MTVIQLVFILGFIAGLLLGITNAVVLFAVLSQRDNTNALRRGINRLQGIVTRPRGTVIEPEPDLTLAQLEALDKAKEEGRDHIPLDELVR